MKRIVKFGFQVLKDTIDTTKLGKSAQKTVILQKICFQILLVVFLMVPPLQKS